MANVKLRLAETVNSRHHRGASTSVIFRHMESDNASLYSVVIS